MYKPKYSVRLLLIMLVVMMIGSLTQGAVLAKEPIAFSDIEGHWAEQEIKGAVSKGYVDGYQDGTFRPNDTLTRAEFLKMLVVALELEVDPSSTDKWYKPYLDAALTKGYYVIGDFASEEYDKPMSRAEMAMVVARATGEKKVEPKQGLYLVTRKGIIGGTAVGEVNPEGMTTRAQAITVIERTLSVKGGNVLPAADKYTVGAAEIYWHRTNIYSVAPEVFNHDGTGINYWNESRLTLTSYDGNYKAELVKLVAIDLSDPKDPNRKLIPKEGMEIRREIVDETGTYYGWVKVDEHSDMYAIIMESKLIHRKSNSYSDEMKLNVFGFDASVDKVSGSRLSFVSDGITRGFVVAKDFKLETLDVKTGKKKGLISAYLDTPGGGGSFKRQQIISTYMYQE